MSADVDADLRREPADLLNWTAVYRAAGFQMIPVHARAKRPAVADWPNAATTEASQIARWFSTAGTNVGVVCGPSHIIVIDVDRHATDGYATLAALEADIGPLPRTVTADTGGGGEHRIYRRPKGDLELVTSLGGGVDLLHGAKQILVEPSIHPSGQRYRWRDGLAPGETPIAELPPAWLARMKRPMTPAPASPLTTRIAGESVYYVLAALDQGHVLTCISGSALVGGEAITLGRPRTNGHRAIIVDGRATGGFIDESGRIGHRSTGTSAEGPDGGPLVSTWLRFYGHTDSTIRSGLIRLVPELARFAASPTNGTPTSHREQPMRGDLDADAEAPPANLGDREGAIRYPEDHRAAERASRGGRSGGPGAESSEPPEIIITTDQAGVVNQAEAALLACGGVFVRGRTLVNVVRDHGGTDFLRRPGGMPVIVRVGRERLRELCGAAANWVRESKSGDMTKSMVPAWVSATLLERGEWRFPALDGISDAPVFRADGTIHDTPGYDPATRVLYEPSGVTYPPTTSSPTQAAAVRALAELMEPFADFPFVAASDRAATAALILSIIARAAIDGSVPMFVARAPTPGSGKGLVIDAATMIATGRASPKMAPTTDDDELRKRLLAIALEAPSIVMIDNVEGTLGSPVLAMALTAGVIHERILGSTEMRAVPLRAVFAATGNNLQLRRDSGRRVVPIDLDPLAEHPEDRQGFRHRDLLRHLRDVRAGLYVAALTVLRAYIVAGRPDHGRPAKGSYEAWDGLVRGAVIWAGGADPLAGVARIREDGDEDLERLRALLVAWRGQFGEQGVTIAEAISRAGETGPLYDALVGYSRNGKADARQLGYALRKIRGRIAGGLVLDRENGRAGTCCWRVRAPAGDGGDGGDGDDDRYPKQNT